MKCEGEVGLVGWYPCLEVTAIHFESDVVKAAVGHINRLSLLLHGHSRDASDDVQRLSRPKYADWGSSWTSSSCLLLVLRCVDTHFLHSIC